MKILQINNCHFRRGGADVVYLNTGELLEQKGNQVFYFSQKKENNLKCSTEDYFIDSIDFFNESFLYRCLKIPRFFYSFEAARKLKTVITKFKPEIAHIHTYKGTLTPSILKILKKNYIPVVFSIHDYGLLCPHNTLLDGKEKICTRCLDKDNTIHCIINKCNRNNRILSIISAIEYNFHQIFIPFSKHFTTLIAVSKFSYELHVKKKEYKNKITHLYNFFPALNEIQLFKKKGEYFLFYGRLSPEKGIVTLLKAWKSVKKNIVLKIVGEGSQKDEILNYIAENNLDNIIYEGFMQKEELFLVIQNASFIIVPSQWNENNPLSIIEAYAYGKPVIASRIGGIPEIVIENKTGFLFNMGNDSELAEIISKAALMSEKKYSEMSSYASSYAQENFNGEKHYNKLMDIYKKSIEINAKI